jgi:hypothetical protein
VFENRVLMRIFGRNRKVTEHCTIRSSPDIIRMRKSRRIRWAEQAVHIGRVRNACNIWSGNLKGRDHWENTDDWRIM